MKKSIIVVLITATLVFAAFVGGFYVGRNYNLGSIQINGLLPESTDASTTVNNTADSTASTTAGTTAATGSDATAPAPGTTAAPQPTVTTAPGLINVNTATLEELDTLPGIGPKIAQAIIDYRTEYGDFEAPEDLLHVPGIGDKKLEAIIDLITTGG